MRWVGIRTAEARQRAARDRQRWREHLAGCPACSAAARRRRPDAACPAGAALRGARDRTRLELAGNRRLDTLPAAGQGTLFS